MTAHRRDLRGGGVVLHEQHRRVLMDDTDAAGVIYFGSVYRWHESVVAEWLDSIAHPMRSLLLAGVAFPCVHSEADYTHPLRVDDVLAVRLMAAHVGRTSFSLVSEAWLADGPAVTVRASYVWSRMPSPDDPAFGPKAIPPWLRTALGGRAAAVIAS